MAENNGIRNALANLDIEENPNLLVRPQGFGNLGGEFRVANNLDEEMQNMEEILMEDQQNIAPGQLLIPNLNQQHRRRGAQNHQGNRVRPLEDQQNVAAAQIPAQGAANERNAGDNVNLQRQLQQNNGAGERGRPNEANENQHGNAANRGNRGVRAGRNQRRYTPRRLNPYERDLKNVADMFVNMVHSSTARTRENLEKERALKEKAAEEE